MNDQGLTFEAFYKSLKSKETTIYPKTCNNCGKIFNNSKDFFLKTKKLNNGIKFSEDNGATVIEIFRNCSCGSTLLSNFFDSCHYTKYEPKNINNLIKET